MNLTEKRCVPCEGGAKPLNKDEAAKLLGNLNDWKISADHKLISKTFEFKNYYHTMAFVNATAWISNQENHHPDLSVGYNRCVVEYTTHAIDGLSENDFICAAKVDVLVKNK